MAQADLLLARHCGAVLLEQRPAALFAMPGNLPQSQLTGAVTEIGMDCIVLYNRRGHPLLLVYRAAALTAALKHPLAQKILGSLGYPLGGTLAGLLDYLGQRVADDPAFPHEIGFFLGYPPADVVGFILYGGRQYKYCGMWKVYSNVDRAKELCSQYCRCRDICCSHVALGGRLCTLKNVV